MRRQADTTRVWRVRGYNGPDICHSRVYQRRDAAIRNYVACLDYYDRVTIEQAEVGTFTPIDARERALLLRWT